MKKQYSAILLLLSLTLAVPVFAEDEGASSSPSNTKVERRIEVQQNLAKRKAEHTARVLTATVGRLGKIADRLDSRIAKVDAAGGTTTDAKMFVAEAREHLSLATSSIATFASLNLTGDKVKENFEKVRTLATEVKGHIREAHRSLKNAVRALKGISTDD